MATLFPTLPPHALSDALRKALGVGIDPADPASEQACADAMHNLIESDSHKADEVLALLADTPPVSKTPPIKTGIGHLRMAADAGPVNDDLFSDLPSRSPLVRNEDGIATSEETAFIAALESLRRFSTAHKVELAPPSVLGFPEQQVRVPAFEAAEKLLCLYESDLFRKAPSDHSFPGLLGRFWRSWRLAKRPAFGEMVVCSTRYAPNLTVVEVKQRQRHLVQMGSLVSGTALYLMVYTYHSKKLRRYQLDLDHSSDRPDFEALFENDLEAAGQSISALRAALKDSTSRLGFEGVSAIE